MSDLMNGVALLVVAFGATIVAIVSKASKNPMGRSFFSSIGKLEALAISLAVVALLLGAAKEINDHRRKLIAAEKERQLLVENQRLRNETASILEISRKNEYLNAVKIEVDAFDEAGRRGYNSIRRLAQRGGMIDGKSGKIGITLLFSYGDFSMYISGITGEDDHEEWLFKIFSKSGSTYGYYEAPMEPLKMFDSVTKRREFYLVNVMVNDQDIKKYVRTGILLANVISRGESTPASFDPKFELGIFEVIRFCSVSSSSSAMDFAQEKIILKCNRNIELEQSFLHSWHVRATLNGREIGSPHIFRSSSWYRDFLKEVPERYIPKANQLVMIPIGPHWKEYALLFNTNTKKLVFNTAGEVIVGRFPPQAGPR